MSPKKFLSLIYYLKLVSFLDIIAAAFLFGSLLLLLVPLGLHLFHVYCYLLFVVSLTLFRMIYAAVWAVNETLSYSKIQLSLLMRLIY